MPIEKIVLNASPLILLCKADLESLLPALFTEIYIPDAVSREIAVGNDVVSSKVAKATWLQGATVEVSSEILVWNLGPGESEVLSLALGNEEYTAVIDDRAARNCALTLSIRTLGTGAVLILAKRKGLIDSVGSALAKLKDAGLYISDEVTTLVTSKAGE